MTMMEAAGVPPRRVAYIQRRALLAESYVAELYGGRLRPELDPLGDIDVGPAVWDVKRVEPGWTWVNCGSRRPRANLIIIVEDDRIDFAVVGAARPFECRWELPPVRPGLDPQPCWLLTRPDVGPAPARTLPWEELP